MICCRDAGTGLHIMKQLSSIIVGDEGLHFIETRLRDFMLRERLQVV